MGNGLIIDSVSYWHQVWETEYVQQCISILTPEEHEGDSIPGPTISAVSPRQITFSTKSDL